MCFFYEYFFLKLFSLLLLCLHSLYIRYILCCTPVRVYIIIINNNTLLDRAESNFWDKAQTTRRSWLYTGAKLLHRQARRSRKFIYGPLKLHRVSQLYIYYITKRSIHEPSDYYPPPAKNKKSAPQSHTRYLIIPPPLNHKSGQWWSENRFRRIYQIPIHVYTWAEAYHHTTVVELMNYWIADCRSGFQSYYQSVRDYYTRITILYIHSVLHIYMSDIWRRIVRFYILFLGQIL